MLSMVIHQRYILRYKLDDGSASICVIDSHPSSNFEHIIWDFFHPRKWDTTKTQSGSWANRARQKSHMNLVDLCNLCLCQAQLQNFVPSSLTVWFCADNKVIWLTTLFIFQGLLLLNIKHKNEWNQFSLISNIKIFIPHLSDYTILSL